MRKPTDGEIDAALREHAEQGKDGRWRFPGSIWRERIEARDIVEACLRMDMVVTDTLTGAQWIQLLRTVAELEERVDRLAATCPYTAGRESAA